jgi:hypothetical protein
MGGRSHSSLAWALGIDIYCWLVRIQKHSFCIHGALVGPNLFGPMTVGNALGIFEKINVLANQIGRMNSALHGVWLFSGGGPPGADLRV